MGGSHARRLDPLAGLDASTIDDAQNLSDDSAWTIELFNAYQEAVRSAPVVSELDGQEVQLPGFMVPTDSEGTETSEFLLVPYFGACIHVPPPPSNPIVYVKTGAGYPMKELFDPVWVTSVISTQALWGAGLNLHDGELSVGLDVHAGVDSEHVAPNPPGLLIGSVADSCEVGSAHRRGEVFGVAILALDFGSYPQHPVWDAAVSNSPWRSFGSCARAASARSRSQKSPQSVSRAAKPSMCTIPVAPAAFRRSA